MCNSRDLDMLGNVTVKWGILNRQELYAEVVEIGSDVHTNIKGLSCISSASDNKTLT